VKSVKILIISIFITFSTLSSINLKAAGPVFPAIATLFEANEANMLFASLLTAVGLQSWANYFIGEQDHTRTEQDII